MVNVVSFDQQDNIIYWARTDSKGSIYVDRLDSREDFSDKIQELNDYGPLEILATEESKDLVGQLKITDSPSSVQCLPRAGAIYHRFKDQLNGSPCIVICIEMNSAHLGCFWKGRLLGQNKRSDLALVCIWNRLVSGKVILRRRIEELKKTNPQVEEVVFRGFQNALQGTVSGKKGLIDFGPPIDPVDLGSCLPQIKEAIQILADHLDPKRYLILSNWAALGNLPKLLEEEGYSVLKSPDPFFDAVRGLVQWRLSPQEPIEIQVAKQEGSDRLQEAKGPAELKQIDGLIGEILTEYPEKGDIEPAEGNREAAYQIEHQAAKKQELAEALWGLGLVVVLLVVGSVLGFVLRGWFGGEGSPTSGDLERENRVLNTQIKELKAKNETLERGLKKQTEDLKSQVSAKDGEIAQARAIIASLEERVKKRDGVASAPCSMTPITPGKATSGSLADGDCEVPGRSGKKADFYTFSGTTGQQVTITMSSAAFDSYLILVGSNGNIVAQNDDIRQGERNSRIDLSLPTSGTYRIEATAYDSSGKGNYTISLSLVDKKPVVKNGKIQEYIKLGKKARIKDYGTAINFFKKALAIDRSNKQAQEELEKTLTDCRNEKKELGGDLPC